MRNLKITLEYDGTRYSGWQIQKNARTVGGVFAEGVAGVLGESPAIFAAGRTDAGVHAMAQVVSFRTRSDLTLKEIRERLNDQLPADLSVLDVEGVPLSFHARHAAVSRTYRYQVSTRRTAFGKRYVWWVRSPLDRAVLREGAEAVLKARDFRSFADVGTDAEGEGPRSAGTRVQVAQSAWTEEGHLLIYRIKADRFLWKMVRRLVGTMVAVANSRLDRASIARWLAEPSRESAALTAPPSGLFLESVEYPRSALAGRPEAPRA